MAKVKLLRDHLDNKAGDSIEVANEQLNYFKAVKLIADGKEPVSEQDGETKAPGQRGRKPKSN